MKVLLVDDHPLIRARIHDLLRRAPELDVVGESSNGQDALEQVARLQPDVVLMDVNMPVLNGTEATKIIRQRHPHVKVLALTASADMSVVSAMVKAGASGYLLKGGSAGELLNALKAVGKGQGAVDREVTGGLLKDMAELYKKEQERADALAELDRMKSEFVSVVSHELRTPLTSIKGGVRTLRGNWDAIDDDTKFEFLDSISDQCDRLTRMVGQILTVAGIHSGGLGSESTVFDLDGVVREAVATLEPSAVQGRVKLDLRKVIALGDKARTRDIAVGLIQNALSFTSGPVDVTVRSDGGIPKLSVSDSGPGMEADVLARLLDTPFTQGDSSDTRSVGGLGLSLYAARRVLEASGGRLDVDTAPDRGSTFTVVLPQAVRFK